LFINKASLDIFNCASEEQVLGHSGFEFMPETQPDGKKTKDVVAEAFKEDSATVEMQCVKLTGEPFIARIHSITMNYEGRRASLAVIEDTTAEKEYQEKLRNIALQEQEANQLKNRFLAMVSHEIRTPINAIIGMMEIQLQKENNPPETDEVFEKIHESGSLLLNIINDILDFSKITENKLEITPVRYDIPSLINDAVQLNFIRLESKPINFIVSLDPNTPLELIGDDLRIKQILNNVLSNAFKYTDEGEIELSVSSEPSSGGTPSEDVIIVFRARDTGQGITEEHIGRLFEDFTRFNLNINRTVTGTGLGLSITKHLIDLMNGEITVESQPEKGSAFTVRLPQKRFGDALCGEETARRLREFDFHSAAIAKKTRIKREYMPYGKVLVVDDVKSNLFVAKGLLSAYGLQIDAIDNGADAVEKIKNGGAYDVIFMDHMMPVMDGIEAARKIRGLGYGRPIIALTANALAGQSEMFMQNGFDGYIPKPIDSLKLNALLNELIRDKKPLEVVEAARRKRLRKRTPENKARLSEIEKYFLADAKNAAERLGKMAVKINAIGEKDMASYKVAVHSMKSALANIGETKLSDAAQRLEKAAEEKDTILMEAETPAFMEALKSIIEKLSQAEENASGKMTEEKMAYLQKKLAEVKTACETIDMGAFDEVMEDLKQKEWPGGINEALDALAVHILHSDFDRAASLAEETLNNAARALA
ncbi:MAG: response regulator, partial [Treponema sp.]|nr:response regulator [Treponema sp.]